MKTIQIRVRVASINWRPEDADVSAARGAVYVTADGSVVAKTYFPSWAAAVEFARTHAAPIVGGMLNRFGHPRSLRDVEPFGGVAQAAMSHARLVREVA